MTGFGIPFGGFDQNAGEFEDKDYDPDEVFRRFRNDGDETSRRPSRTTHSLTAGGVPVETRHRRTVKMPY